MFYKLSRRFFITAFALLVILPCLIVILSSFKDNGEILTNPLALPKKWDLDNYTALINRGNIFTPFKNSVIVSSFSVFFTLLLGSMAAYAITRMITVKGKWLFLIFSIGLAIPGQVNIIPIYILFVKLGLTNSFVGLVLLYVAVCMPLTIFILCAFFKEVPKEMYEVAGIDGAGQWDIYRRIALPLSMPAMSATGIFLFVITWNDLLFPLMLITKLEMKTLPLTLIDYMGEYSLDYSLLFTAVLVASLPMVLMYVFMQKSFVAGITAGAVKG